jgi:hypothetical protein
VPETEDFESLEQASGSGCLGPGVPDPYVRPYGDARKPSKQGGMQRKSHESRYGLDGAERPEPALVGTLPGSLELVAKSLPLVKLSLPDLSPTLETAHLVSS